MNGQLLFEAIGISKNYQNVKALNQVDFNIRKGEIVGLVGENGAGKSTLLKIMMGIEKPDHGAMIIMGSNYCPQNPKQANQMGVGMVFQEQSLINNLTVAQNIFFGDEEQFKKSGFINWKAMDQAARDILNKLGLADIKPDKKISDLQFSRRQMVEIAKVLHRASQGREEGSLILLDEPTSVLNSEEMEVLFDRMKRLKSSGHGIVFISHRLDEVLEVSDRIFVFKDGENVCNLLRKEANEEILYEKMVGKCSSQEFYRVNRQSEMQKIPLMEAQSISKYGFFKDISFTLHAGEIIGICGVIGSGKEELCAVLAGDDALTSGELKIEGRRAMISSPNEAVKDGVSCIPTERRIEGQIGLASIKENISYSNMKKIVRYGIISNKLEENLAEKWIQRLSIKCTNQKQPIENLSGGNAQKVVFARVLSSDAKIIILNHPTRGVDVGAKEEIYEIIRDTTQRGIGIILLGDTLDETIGLSNTIFAMKDGEITGVFEADPDTKPCPLDIIQYMM